MVRNPFSSGKDAPDDGYEEFDPESDGDDSRNETGQRARYTPRPSSVPPVVDDTVQTDQQLPHDFKVYPGTYLFSIGPPQSGKSTFQSLLLRYLLTSGDFATTQIRMTDGFSEDADQLFLSWQKSWDEDRFPARTTVRFPSVLQFRVTPLRYQGIPRADFGIIEVSGEDYERLTRPSNERLQLPRILEEYLAHPKVRLIFAFVCRGSDPRGADRLFLRMIEELAYRNPSFAKKCSTLFVIADPKSAKSYLAARAERQLPPGPLNQAHFIKEALPMSSNALMEWRVRYKQAKFDVGPLAVDTNGDVRIKRFENGDAQKIFEWMYPVITGYPYGPSRQSRFLAEVLGISGKKRPGN